ncbi:sigma-70 family RNA polymerase sigma factor [Streptomyces sp. NPDC006458]|uniref:sigma-70 family RNA polymerase sigma factor n=1 Tax=Streptomyces sp. NPDC006458 TaxID=3154302 RepID=UPI0033B92030
MADPEMPRSRHAEALEALVQERYARMIRFARSRLRNGGVPQSSADPEDVVHNALRAVLAVTEPIGNMRAYVYACMGTEITRAVERHAMGRGYASLDADVRLADELAVHPVAEAELRHARTEARDDLPLQQRKVMLLTWELGMTHAEAAQVLRIAPGTVGVHAHRAIRALRVTLVCLGTALVAWTNWIMTAGRREIIPAAGIESPADVVTLGLTSTVVVLISVLAGLVTWTRRDIGLRWAQLLRALLKPAESAQASRDETGSPSASAETETPEPTTGFPSFRGGAEPPQ